MAGRVLACCAPALFLHLTCVAATLLMLNDLDDLKTIHFQQSVPRHGLPLLHWFANQVDIRPHWIRLNFDPRADYGSHYYGNSDGLLPHRPPGYQYYTVGNLNTDGAVGFPDYVRYQQRDHDGYNRARIIFRVNGQTIDRVYLTQHYGNNQGSSYDPHHTYEISAALLRELREVPRGDLSRFFRPIFNQQGLWYGPFSNVQAAAESSQGAGSALDTVECIGKWVLIVLVIIVVFAIIILSGSKTQKPPGW